LSDQSGDTVRLSDHAGQWVVLYFYPKDDTPGCTKEACQFTDALGEFHVLDATVLGVSPDSPERHALFIAKYNLRHVLLADPEHTVMAAYSAWGKKDAKGVTTAGVIRSTWIIDPAGTLAWHWPAVKADGHAAEVEAKLRELRKTG
jgi:peroxiredoxin Q/BCP